MTEYKLPLPAELVGIPVVSNRVVVVHSNAMTILDSGQLTTHSFPVVKPLSLFFIEDHGCVIPSNVDQIKEIPCINLTTKLHKTCLTPPLPSGSRGYTDVAMNSVYIIDGVQTMHRYTVNDSGNC